jgi:hypothetical protein
VGFLRTGLRENVLLQAKACQAGDARPAVDVPAGAMQNPLGQEPGRNWVLVHLVLRNGREYVVAFWKMK